MDSPSVNQSYSETPLLPSKILNMDGQVFARGAIRIATAPSLGIFLPDREEDVKILDTLIGSTLVAETQLGQQELSKWERCPAAHLEGDRVTCPAYRHYHFVCESFGK